MLTTRNTGLVSGVGLPPTPLVLVKALRGFFDEKKQPRKAGEIVEATERFALSLIAMHKAERYTAPPEPQVVTVTPELLKAAEHMPPGKIEVLKPEGPKNEQVDRAGNIRTARKKQTREAED